MRVALQLQTTTAELSSDDPVGDSPRTRRARGFEREKTDGLFAAARPLHLTACIRHASLLGTPDKPLDVRTARSGGRMYSVHLVRREDVQCAASLAGGYTVCC